MYPSLDEWLADQDKELKKLPVCEDCGEYIQDEYYYEIGGRKMCLQCLEEYKVWND